MKNILLLLCSMFAAIVHSYGQGIDVVKGSDTVHISHHPGAAAWIGLTTTATDTVRYNDGKSKDIFAYEIAEINPHSITLKRPLEYRDTVFEYQSIYYLPYVAKHLRLKEHFKEDNRKLYRAMVISKYEYRTFAYKDITSIQYPPKVNEKQTGCIMCVLMFPIYPQLIRQANERSVPKSYKMPEWQLIYRSKE